MKNIIPRTAHRFIVATIITFLFLFINKNAHAQQGQWTWMNGNNYINSNGVFGTQSVFAAGNTPPALYEACEWTDKEGNFWLFGGLRSSAPTEFSDLWEYKPALNQWAWIKGPGIANQAGIYGTFMVPSPSNNPGCRAWGVATWVDTAGDLWLFGGLGKDIVGTHNQLNDLWRYNIATNEWTWMNGMNTANDPGDHGSLLVPDQQNIPPSRYETNASWTDNDDNLWLFGGFDGGYLSDVWMFNMSFQEWAWMAGPNITNQPAVYGILGVPDPANTPDGRMVYAKWKESNGDFWMYGGWDGADNWNPKSHNDLWRFDPVTWLWTWMKGDSTANPIGLTGTLCVGAVELKPRGRMENRACWTRKCDNFVNFGGTYDEGLNSYNDLWEYSLPTNTWTQISGNLNANQAGSYGTITVSSATNMPCSRMGSIGWSDTLGNLWMFGGCSDFSVGRFLNDLWRFVPDTTCPHIVGTDTVTSAFNAQPVSGCSPLAVTFNNTSINGSIFHWSFGDTTFSTSVNPTHIYTHGGTYTVTLIANASCAIHPDTTTITITVYPGAAPVITGDSSLCTGGISILDAGTFASYHWSTGATSETITTTTTNTFTVTVTNANGCTGTATKTVTIHPLPTPSISGADSLCSGDTLIIDAGFYSHFHWNNGDTVSVLFITASGTYIVTVTDAFGCSATSSKTITVNPTPTPAITASGATTFCQGDSVTFNVGTYTSYLWNTTATSQVITVNTSGIYIVTVTSMNGCTATALQTVNVIPIPAVSSAFIADTLSGCNPLTVHFTNHSINGVTYLWDFGDHHTDTAKNPTHTYTDTGTFTITLLTINDTSLCGRFADSTSHVSYIVVANKVVITNQFAVNPMKGCTPMVVTITNTTTNASSYYWNLGNGQTSYDKTPPITLYNDSGTYYITLISYASSKCYTAPDTLTISIHADSCALIIPNVFSPNEDGKNDFFNLIADGYTNYRLLIFNRWGMKVFESTDAAILWNGKVNNTGGICPDGTYYYIFAANDITGSKVSEKGFITLIR